MMWPMPTKQDKLTHLRNVSLFAECSAKDIAKIAKASDEIELAAGHVLCDQGQTGREAFVIMAGTATVRRNGKKVATLGPGSVVGELSLLDRGPRTATVTTDTAVTVLVIDSRHFAGVLQDIPTLAGKIMGVLAGRIRDFDRTIYG